MFKYGIVFLFWIIFYFQVLNFYFFKNDEVNFFNVGQGDGMLLRIENKNIIIDGGPSHGFYRQVNEALPWWDQKIDLVIITHEHLDHWLGIESLMKRNQVEKIIASASIQEKGAYNQFVNRYRDKIEIHAEEKVIKLSDQAILRLLKLPPESKNKNNNSVVALLEWNELKILFTGDAEHEAEEFYIEHYGDYLNSDLLKLGHHGSRTSSSKFFLDQVTPVWGIISAGHNNKFSHPHNETIEKLNAHEILWWNTADFKLIQVKLSMAKQCH